MTASLTFSAAGLQPSTLDSLARHSAPARPQVDRGLWNRPSPHHSAAFRSIPQIIFAPDHPGWGSPALHPPPSVLRPHINYQLLNRELVSIFDRGVWTVDCGQHSPDFGLWTLDFGEGVVPRFNVLTRQRINEIKPAKAY
jgi:hypothetical protein